jgi:hypothetical protein
MACVFKGYLDQSHYNFSDLEKRHYNSCILKFSITILFFPPKRYRIRMETTWTHSQAYMTTYTSL